MIDNIFSFVYYRSTKKDLRKIIMNGHDVNIM